MTSISQPKLTKKQRKGLAFRNKASKDSDILENESPEVSKRKRDDGRPLSDESEPSSKKPKLDSDQTVQVSNKKKENGRYILFVGNLRYSSTKQAILEHFSKCDPPPSVRLISSKGSTKSKGCAFVEFSHPNALQQGLKLHHTKLDGRKINVELTAGGGGKGEERVRKLRKRNQTLNEQRDKIRQSNQSHPVSTVPAESNGDSEQLCLTSGLNNENVKRVAQRKTAGNSKASREHRVPKPARMTGANAISVG